MINKNCISFPMVMVYTNLLFLYVVNKRFYYIELDSLMNILSLLVLVCHKYNANVPYQLHNFYGFIYNIKVIPTVFISVKK